ncbi:MAG: Cyclic di-GMP phosphodiesterase response regulator RpfG [Candidatus Omnitrophica bacterium ADurb.Bin292]|jgi:putative nucleotidyltransferase with HDIG domain|nr:MAG: Cyclic di-GMP phosphodiesterase response regulator RpfG [Candidatus Omnitrophica bacterium ADurb.Bin292]HQB11712.1 HD domain-containing phosphohydrolase [Candidatus Omnitrophota bacterium]
MTNLTRTNRQKKTEQKFDYQEALRDVARSMVRLKRPDRLLKLITRFIDRQFGLHHTSLLVHEPSKNRYVFVNSKGARRVPAGLLKFDSDHPLIRWFALPRRKTPFQEDYLLLTDIKKTLNKAHFRLAADSRASELVKVQKTMEVLRVELVIPGYFKNDLVGILMLGGKFSGRFFTSSEILFFQTLAHDCSMAIKTAEYNQSLLEKNRELENRLQEIEKLRHKEQRTYYEIIRSLAEEVEAKEPTVFGHVSQVEKLGMMTARELGIDLSGQHKDILSAALMLHDVGKIGVPDHILMKPGSLTPEEWEVMKSHVEKGAKILEPLSDFRKVKEIILSHHERFDGTGYPRGLKGEDILIEARIVSVVDSFHAIVSNRCYREGRSIDFALQELEHCAGTQFDPQVVEAFIRVIRREIAKGRIDVTALQH